VFRKVTNFEIILGDFFQEPRDLKNISGFGERGRVKVLDV